MNDPYFWLYEFWKISKERIIITTATIPVNFEQRVKDIDAQIAKLIHDKEELLKSKRMIEFANKINK